MVKWYWGIVYAENELILDWYTNRKLVASRYSTLNAALRTKYMSKVVVF